MRFLGLSLVANGCEPAAFEEHTYSPVYAFVSLAVVKEVEMGALCRWMLAIEYLDYLTPLLILLSS